MKTSKKILILLICLLPLFVMSQTESAEKKQRKLERLTAKKDQKALRDYQKAIKTHHKNQGKDTRKHMKKSLKQSKRNTGAPKKTFFLKRWFTKK